jgi:hypothetical protein
MTESSGNAADHDLDLSLGNSSSRVDAFYSWELIGLGFVLVHISLTLC